ncbi:hypothetical protein Tco_0951904 [Tanacetum coccineum]
MTQAAIWQLIADGIVAALEAQAATMVLCPNMVPNTETLMEVFIGGLPRSIEGNVTTSKPQTLEEAITITQRLRHLADRDGSPITFTIGCSLVYLPRCSNGVWYGLTFDDDPEEVEVS